MMVALATAALSAVVAVAVVAWLVVAVAWWAAVIVVGFALDGFLVRPDQRRPKEPASHPRRHRVRRLLGPARGGGRHAGTAARRPGRATRA